MNSLAALEFSYAEYLATLDTSELEEILFRIDFKTYPDKKKLIERELAARQKARIETGPVGLKEEKQATVSGIFWSALFPLHLILALILMGTLVLLFVPGKYLSAALGALGISYVLIGGATGLFYWLRILQTAGSLSKLLAVGIMFFPFAGLWFSLDHWQQAGTHLVKSLSGLLLCVLGIVAFLLKRTIN